jgi:hypothetical protein
VRESECGECISTSIYRKNPRGRVALEIPKMHMNGVLHKGLMGRHVDKWGSMEEPPTWPATSHVGPP